MERTSTGTIVQDLQNYLDFGKALILCFTSVIHYPSFTHTHIQSLSEQVTERERVQVRERECEGEREKKTKKLVN